MAAILGLQTRMPRLGSSPTVVNGHNKISVVPIQARRSRCWHRLPRVKAVDNNGSGGNDDIENEEVRAALQEAVEMYARAEQVAQQQVKQELRELWAAELAAAPADLARVCSTPESLAAFWSEQGLDRVQAERLARELIHTHSPCCSIDVLAAQLARLHRVLPIEDLGATVSRHPTILELTTTEIAERLITLVDLMSGEDVMEVVARHPRLLTCPDLRSNYETAVSKLTELHPSHSSDVATAAVRDHPELLFRMMYYQAAKAIDDLPMEIQNMLLYSGKGWLRMYKRFSQPW